MKRQRAAKDIYKNKQTNEHLTVLTNRNMHISDPVLAAACSQEMGEAAGAACSRQRCETSEEKNFCSCRFDLKVNFLICAHPALSGWILYFMFSDSRWPTFLALLFLVLAACLPRGGGGVLVVCLWRMYGWDLVGDWFGEERSRAFSVVSGEVKMYSACDAQPLHPAVGKSVYRVV